MTITALGAVGLAFVLDALVAEPPRQWHPVAWFGRLVHATDRAWTQPRLAGLVIAIALPLGAATVAGTSTALSGGLGPPGIRFGGGLELVVAGGWLFVCTSRRMLVDAATAVIDDVDMAPARARKTIQALVSRETTTLSPGELRSGAVESAAENLADGLVGPLLAFIIGAQVSLPVAVGAAVWVKAVNTLDSMLGYPSIPHGTASARLDDLVMWLPARLSAALFALAAVDLRACRRAKPWVAAPPSPNAGWPMATLATALDARLTKPGEYTLNRSAPLPTAEQARRGVRLADRAAILAFVFTGVLAWL